MNKSEEILKLEKQQKILGWVRFLAFPLGWVMYILTVNPFGEIPALILSVASFAGFWLIVSRGRDKEFYDILAKEISGAINKLGHLEHAVELRPLAGSLILRVYLQDPEDRIVEYNKAIYDAISKWNTSTRSWVVQVATVHGVSEINRVRKALDEELLKELEKSKEEGRDIFSNKDKKK